MKNDPAITTNNIISSLRRLKEEKLLTSTQTSKFGGGSIKKYNQP